MSEGEYNQTDEHRRGRSQPDMDGEHETHTTALVLLVLATLVIVVVILSAARTAKNKDLSPGNFDDQISQPADESHGAGIPVEFAQASEISDTSGLPDDIPIPENVDVMQNYESAIGDNGTQRVYMFRTSNPPVSYANQYQQWIASSDFTVDGGDQTDSSFTIRASNESEQLIMNMVDNGSDREVQINYINQSS